ncbi:hypothetical protein [Roseobacter weihaiensis]|uniref:hypothetical protein n=1 Tax=Roseobacter weihaiensis TaxID=2763262 RepID=UPI001D0A58AF|nr:hypothetical protein [Roseobacter sp. H9]
MLKKLCLSLVLMVTPALAEPPVVDHVSAQRLSNGTWRFDVTISHPDTGWDHYADAWRVLDMQGNQLGIRELAHPHVQEQPFTRSLSGVRVPEGTTEVQVQARDKPGGWNPNTKTVRLR